MIFILDRSTPHFIYLFIDLLKVIHLSNGRQGGNFNRVCMARDRADIFLIKNLKNSKNQAFKPEN
jgi:hypothetical protein